MLGVASYTRRLCGQGRFYAGPPATERHESFMAHFTGILSCGVPSCRTSSAAGISRAGARFVQPSPCPCVT
eukprot:2324969-Heterocapsa_arctica.AAC.1